MGSRIPSTIWRRSSTLRWDRAPTSTASPTTAPAASRIPTGLPGCGVPFKAEFFSEPGWEPMGDQGLMYSGGDNSYPFNTVATPAPRGHVPQMQNKKQGEASAGFMLMKPLVEAATAAGARATYDVRVQSLVVESDGRVVGLRGRQERHRGDVPKPAPG